MLTSLDALAEIPVPLEVRVDEAELSVAEMMDLEDGVVIPLSKPAGETLDLFAGNLRLASVEVTLIEDRLAVRITKLEPLS